MSGCKFDAKRSMLLNYLPGAIAHGAKIRPLHEVQLIERTDEGNYRVSYNVLHDVDYRVVLESGSIEAKVVVVAAGAGATPSILMRSAEALGGMPDAVGKYFSGNGERLNTAILNEDRIRDVLGLERPDGGVYQANQIGKGPCVATWDNLDGSLPEYERYSLEQLYFPPGLGTILVQVPGAEKPSWFGAAKKELIKQWQNWLTIFTMIEDDNEGVFGAPPTTGNSWRVSQQMFGLGTLKYEPHPTTRKAWDMTDAAVKDIMERDGLASVLPWTNELIGAYTVHPLSSCRIGDDPATSALDDTHELRGHPGIFVTDGSAVPSALCVNPAMTIAALAERAVPSIVRAARQRGVDVKYGAPSPLGETAGRNGVSKLAVVQD